MEIEYRNSTRLLGVIGDPIAHTLSPLLQNTLIREMGRDQLYLALRVPRGGLPDFLQAARTLNFQGFNLTMPHKVDILPLLDDMTPAARRAGSVNTVRLREGRLEGHSTDGAGFHASLRALGGDFPGRRVAILGAGGAARAIAVTAADAGAEVIILNRTLARGEALCQGEAHMTALPLSRAEEALAEADLLVNTTPVGMEGVAGDTSFPFLYALKPGAAAMDCIYSPPETPFLQAAGALGHPTANGLGMLIYQAIYAYGFFCGEVIPEAEILRLGRLLRDETRFNS